MFKIRNLRYAFYGQEASQKLEEIYQEREGSDSPGSFGFEKTRRINQCIISKNPKTICE